MKNVSLKKIITTVLSIMLVLSVVFVISSCKQHQHTLVETTITEASCAETGTLQIKCSDAKCDYVKTESIPATGHNNVVTIITSPTCTEDGEVQTRCTKCGEKKNDVVKASGHNKVEVAAKGATCTTQGYPKHEKCKDCEWTTLKSTDIIAPLGHQVSNWKDDRQNSKPEYSIQYPNCSEGGYHYEYKECTRTKDSNGQYLNASHTSCGYNLEYVKVEDAPLGHDISTEQARAAGCCIGWDTFDYCNGWTKSELSAKGYPYAPTIATSGPSINNASKGCGYNKYVEHPATKEHAMAINLKYVETKAATCEAEGAYVLIRECTTCTPTNQWPSWNKPVWSKPADYKLDVLVYTEFETSQGSTGGVIAPLGHEWQNHKGQDATCTVDGWKDFIMCTRCSKIDTPDGKVPVIPAGHKPSSDGCLLVCSVCNYVDIDSENGGHKIITKVSDEPNSSQNPTCVEPGFYTCIKWCEKCNKAITTEVVRLDPLGHDYISYAGKKPTCTTVGWNAFNECSRCDYTEFKEIPENGHNLDKENPEELNRREATCTGDGVVQYGIRCLTCKEIAETYSEVLPTIPHTVVKVDELPATCTTKGHSAYEYCSECSRTLTSKYIYNATGHTIVNCEGQEPTCTADGWYPYVKCTNAGCNYNTKADMKINALGHNIVEFPAQDPTCTEKGWNKYTECERCGAYSTKAKNMIDETGHHAGKPVNENVVPATCTADGNYDVVEYCKSCDIELTRVNKVSVAIGHNYSESTGYCQNGCGDRISIGLAYSNNTDGTTCVVSGIGSCTDTEIIIPDEINGRKVVGIAYRAFYYNSQIESVVLSNTVEYIEEDAFCTCTNLKSVTFGTGIKRIEDSAFAGCKSLTNVYYRGTAAQWAKVFVDTNNDKVKNITKYI